MISPQYWNYDSKVFFLNDRKIFDFFDNNIFWMTLIFCGFVFTMIFLLDSKKLIIRYQNVIAYSLAFLTFILFIVYFTFNFMRNGWYLNLLQDLCPAISFVSIPAFLYNKEKLYKALMPWLLVGAIVTMLGGEAKIFSSPIYLITYFEHLLMLIKGLFAYVWIKKYFKKDFLYLLVFPTLLIIWIFFSGFIPWQVTGNKNWVVFSTALFPPSLVAGSSYEILNNLGMPYPVPTILFYLIAITSAFLIALNKNIFVYYFAWIIKHFADENKIKNQRVKIFLEKEKFLKEQKQKQKQNNSDQQVLSNDQKNQDKNC